MFNFCVNGGHAKTKQENCCIVTVRIFCTSDPVQIFLLRRSFLDLISFSGTVSIYVSGVSLCQDKYTNASDPVVTREQRMKEQAWHYFAAVRSHVVCFCRLKGGSRTMVQVKQAAGLANSKTLIVVNIGQGAIN